MTVPKSDIFGFFCIPSGRLDSRTFAIGNQLQKDMQNIYSEFRRIVAATPDALAVKASIRALTYAQLDALADTVAAAFPVGNPAFVGIVMDHSVEMIASILAVLKTGAAYVPAEPSFPIERIRYMMKESGVDFIITHGKYVDYINHGFRKMCE